MKYPITLTRETYRVEITDAAGQTFLCCHDTSANVAALAELVAAANRAPALEAACRAALDAVNMLVEDCTPADSKATLDEFTELREQITNALQGPQ